MSEPAYDFSGGSSGVVVEPSMNPSAAETPREEDELRALVKAHFSFIWRSLRRLGVAANDADDATQRVFWVASQRLADIEAGKERAFLFGTATLVAHEFRRAGKRRPEVAETDVDVPDGGPTLDELVDRRRARALLDDVLDRMPMEQRTVFVLFEFEELSVPEIALLVDAPVGTVSSRLRRGRELFHAAAERVRARASFKGGA